MGDRPGGGDDVRRRSGAAEPAVPPRRVPRIDGLDVDTGVVVLAGDPGRWVGEVGELEVISQYHAWYRTLMGITANGGRPGGDPAPPAAG